MFKYLGKFLKNSSLTLMSLVFSGIIILGGVYFYMAIRLPDVGQLKDMGLQLPLRVFTSDGKLIGEFGEKKRIPVTLNQVPKTLIQAILDTEDQRYYEHRGVDFIGLIRAAKNLAASGKRTQGASTITMQVARNFFLNREKTFSRKINEMLLAFKIDRTFSKEEILELYLNKIYLGQRAYGVAAAAQVYYGKQLNELSLAQIATLAGLPQAPSRDNPIINPAGARERRNHVLQRLLENRHIDLASYNAAIAAPIAARYHELQTEVQAPYVAEMARDAVVAKYGDAAYDNGIKVYTTIDSHLQEAANQALHDGILAYDQRHGYRGPEKHFSSASQNLWRRQLLNIPVYSDLLPAAVIGFTPERLSVLTPTGTTVEVPRDGFAWANPQLTAGDVVRVYRGNNGQWHLAQVPKIEGSIVSLNPKNGAILALSGGFSYAESNYNRAIQAGRQSGSGFKPFVYSAALNKGYTLASVINDAPVVLFDSGSRTLWRPQNDTERFYGPTRLRTALIESRNVVSVRLLQAMGISYTVSYLKKFGFEGAEIPASPSLVLGTGTLTPLKLVDGYAVFANGGYLVTPYFVTNIVDKNNHILQQTLPATVPEEKAANLPIAPRVITPQNAYIITSALKDVITQGTAKKAASLRRADLAGKTGTTNDYDDAWFTGYNSDIATTVWMGFDQPASTYEHGAQAALPVWMQFMEVALAGKPEHSMPQPEGITTARIDPATGLLARPGQRNALFEVFTTDTAPKTVAPVQTTPYEAVPTGGGGDESLSEPLF